MNAAALSDWQKGIVSWLSVSVRWVGDPSCYLMGFAVVDCGLIVTLCIQTTSGTASGNCSLPNIRTSAGYGKNCMAKYRFEIYLVAGTLMSNRKTVEEELARLLEQQGKAHRDEVFGGFTKGERAAFEARSSRIHDLENEILRARQIDSDSAKQRRDWNTQSEPDTPQSEARQPYRSREHDSSKAFTDSQKKSRTKKTDSDESPEN